MLAWCGSLSASVITPISRASEVRAQSINLGPTIGYVGGGFDPVASVTSTLLDSSADLSLSGDLYYGPDMFGRLYSGTYGGLQDVTFTPSVLGGSLQQSASTVVIDPGSPAASSLRSSVANDYTVKFGVSEPILADITISFEGTTQNVGATDFVGLNIKELDANGNPQIAAIFALAFEAGSSTTTEGTYSGQIMLMPGNGYQLAAIGNVRADGTSSDTSYVTFSLRVPAPGTMIALGTLGLLGSRRRRG
jgi:hypothetical protein